MGFDGRKVRMKPGERNSENLFVKYIENSESWASIPSDVKHHYEALYDSSFRMIKAALACDNISVRLTRSKLHPNAHEFRIKKNSE